MRQLLIDAVPALAPPRDRMAAIGARVRRQRRRTTIATSSAVVVVALLTVPVLGGRGIPGRTAAPVAKDDGILRTAGCGVVSYGPGVTVNGEEAGNKEEIDALLARIEPYAPAHFPDVYTGLALDNDHDLVRVYRMPSAEFDAWVRSEFADACVEVFNARHALKGTAELQERITDDFQYWSDRGIEIYTTGVAPDGSVRVGVRGTDVEKARRELPARYGTDIPIDVEEGAPAEF